jgi:hypothetical protein
MPNVPSFSPTKNNTKQSTHWKVKPAPTTVEEEAKNKRRIETK